MQTNEITRSEWSSFFDNFSREHQGWPASLEIIGPDLGAQVEERQLAFAGITDESSEAHGDTITIMVGGTPDEHVTHTINRPKQVSFEQAGDGAAALAIKSEDGVTALLRFR